MGITITNTSRKYGKLFLVVAFLVIVLAEVSTAQRKIDCRKFVFAPPCRGIAAKRDTHSAHGSNLRISPAEDNDDLFLMDGQKMYANNDNFPAVNGFLGLLKRAIAKNQEYDSSSNYLA